MVNLPPADESATVSVVVPVYQGARTLDALLAEIAPLTAGVVSPGGNPFRVVEVVLVHDGARDASAEVMQDLAARHSFVRTVWLSRNFGQHPATMAGIEKTSGRFVLTLDEDGQQDPSDAGKMLDVALRESAQLVYARPTNPPPHGFVRNLASRAAKRVFVALTRQPTLAEFNSFRLIDGEVARGLARYCGPGVYLDVALTWVVGRSIHCPLAMRPERGRPSGYTGMRLLAHFWRLLITSGTRPLRAVTAIGFLAVVAAGALSAVVAYRKIMAEIPVRGWTSLIVVICFFAGTILMSLGIVAEYVGVAVSMAMGRPPYLTVSQAPGARRRSEDAADANRSGGSVERR